MDKAKIKAELRKRVKLATAFEKASREYLTHLAELSASGEKRAPGWIAEAARGPIAELFSMVRRDGNPHAAEALVNSITGSVESLTYSPSREAFQAIARKRVFWPALIFARGKENAATVRGFAAQMELGKECGLKLNGKTASFETPETRVAFSIWQCIEHDRKQGSCDLPPLSREKENFAQWWKAAEVLLLEFYGSNFHEHSEFVHWNKKFRNVELNQRTGMGEQKKYTPGVLKKGIKDKVKQALRSLADSMD